MSRAFPFDIQGTPLQRCFNIFTKQEDMCKKCPLFFARSHKFYTLLHPAVQYILRFIFFLNGYPLRKVFCSTMCNAHINQTGSPPPLVPLATIFVTTVKTFALPSMTSTIPHLIFFSNLPSSFSLCITDTLEQNHHSLTLCRIRL